MCMSTPVAVVGLVRLAQCVLACLRKVKGGRRQEGVPARFYDERMCCALIECHPEEGITTAARPEGWPAPSWRLESTLKRFDEHFFKAGARWQSCLCGGTHGPSCVPGCGGGQVVTGVDFD